MTVSDRSLKTASAQLNEKEQILTRLAFLLRPVIPFNLMRKQKPKALLLTIPVGFWAGKH